MRRVIMAGGPLYDYAGIRAVLRATDELICADSGAYHARMIRRVPHAVIGDMDSIDDTTRRWLRKHRVRQITHPVRKDQSDTEICLLYEPIPTTTLLIASLGGRPDHTLSLLLLMGKFARPDRHVSLYDGRTWVKALVGPATVCLEFQALNIARPDHLFVSLFPLFSSAGPVTTQHLLYPLDKHIIFPGDTLCLSNRVMPGAADMTVTIDKGVVLLMLTPQEASSM